MKEKLLTILKKVMETNKIDETVSRKKLNAWDSLKHINLIVELESEFDISIEPEEFELLTDFQSIAKLITEKTSV